MTSLKSPTLSPPPPPPQEAPYPFDPTPPRRFLTYHCLCTQLLLATPYTLGSLPRRQSSALDHAIILPLGAPPRSQQNDDGDLEGNDDDDDDDDDDERLHRISDEHVSAAEDVQGRIQYSLLLSTTVDRKPIIVRREDGFEKRQVQRCGRCRLEIGYMLAVDGDTTGGKNQSSETGGGKAVYLLPGGLVETEELKKEAWQGRDADIVLGEG